MTKIFVFVPAYRGQISAETVETTHAIASACLQKGIPVFFSTFSWFDISELRNVVLSYWYDCMQDFTHLLMIDDDMGFDPPLLFDMLAFGEPLVGGIYPKKTLPRDWVVSGVERPEVRGGAFVEVEGIGGGCMLIRRDVVDTLIEKFPDLQHPDVLIARMKQMGLKRTLLFFDQYRVPTGKVAEDIAFCRRYREAGGRVWGAIGHEITHVGAWPFSGCFAREANERQVEQDKILDMAAQARGAAAY
jgi:hypothetical protein